MTMMQTQLTMRVLMERAEMFAPETEIVSKMRDGVHRHNYAQIGARARQLANVLAHLGVKQGDRIGTLAWNSFRHLELYYAVPCMGAVLHTLNLRLAADQLAYVINHADEKFAKVIVIPSWVQLTAGGLSRWPSVVWAHIATCWPNELSASALPLKPAASAALAAIARIRRWVIVFVPFS